MPKTKFESTMAAADQRLQDIENLKQEELKKLEEVAAQPPASLDRVMKLLKNRMRIHYEPHAKAGRNGAGKRSTEGP